MPALYPHQVQLQARRGCAARRRPDGPAVRRRAHRGLDLHPVVQRGLRLEARVAGRPRPGDRVHRARRRRRAPRREPRPRGRHPPHRGAARGRDDELAPGASSGGRAPSASAAEDLLVRLPEEPELQLLDVRERAEWDEGHVPGSLSCPGTTSARCPRASTRTRPIAVICAGGLRAATAASLLERARRDAGHPRRSTAACRRSRASASSWSRAPPPRRTCRPSETRRSVVGEQPQEQQEHVQDVEEDPRRERDRLVRAARRRRLKSTTV